MKRQITITVNQLPHSCITCNELKGECTLPNVINNGRIGFGQEFYYKRHPACPLRKKCKECNHDENYH